MDVDEVVDVDIDDYWNSPNVTMVELELALELNVDEDENDEDDDKDRMMICLSRCS